MVSTFTNNLLVTMRTNLEASTSRHKISTAVQGVEAFLICRTIRIGSYIYTPKEQVHISVKGVNIVAPSLKNESEDVAIQISSNDISRVSVHFGKGPVIFLYAVKTLNITKALGMEESGRYYNNYLRITLYPEVITEETKVAIKALFHVQICELDLEEANDFIFGPNCSYPPEIHQILIYPPGKGGIPINTEDYRCLARDQPINDVIIDFYLKYLHHDILTSSQRKKTHIFSTFFYKRLTTEPSKVNRNSNPHEWDSSLTAAQKRHARVKTLTKHVNIFEKDFIVVPIKKNCHWFVAIICYPSLDECQHMVDNRKRIKRKESDLDMQCDSDEEEIEKPPKKKPKLIKKKYPIPIPIKQPCILIFDPLAAGNRSSRRRVLATLRDYLTCEYQAKMSDPKIFDKDSMEACCPNTPQQNNFSDGGLYLLQYVEHFFKDPICDYTLPIKPLANWFDEIVVTRKREEISDLLKQLINKYNPDSHLHLPNIKFPTLKGVQMMHEDELEKQNADENAFKEEASTSSSAGRGYRKYWRGRSKSKGRGVARSVKKSATKKVSAGTKQNGGESARQRRRRQRSTIGGNATSPDYESSTQHEKTVLMEYNIYVSVKL